MPQPVQHTRLLYEDTPQLRITTWFFYHKPTVKFTGQVRRSAVHKRGVTTYTMLLISTSALNRAFRGLRGRQEVPHTNENATHGGPSTRRAEARRVLGTPCVVFSYVSGTSWGP
jgi:hypothetical protein